MRAGGDGLAALSVVDAELEAVRQAIAGLERDLAEAEDELARAHVIRRHVARHPERFAPHEREDVFERTERLSGRRQELAALLGAANERAALLEALRGSIAAQQRQLEELAAASAPAPAANRLSALEVHRAVEAERLRIARDLHDGPAQVLSNLVLEAEILERLLTRDPALLQSELQGFKNSVKNAVNDVRRFMFDLRPDSLDDLGLVATLRRFTTEWQQRTGITCRFNLTGEDLRLPPAREEALFRIVQEALNNVRRHAGARSVEVNLDIRRDGVRLRIRDDGRGFDAEAGRDPAGPPKLGVVGMQERAAAVGGRLAVRSRPGSGTDIEAEFPAGD